MLDLARQHAEDLGRQVELREGDAAHLPVDDEAFDTVVCAWSLCTIPDPVRTIEEMRRAVSPAADSCSWTMWAAPGFRCTPCSGLPSA